MSKLRIAMVGAGAGRGQSWMSTLAKLSEPDELYEFCGLCEVVPEKRQASAEKWGVPGYANLIGLLDGAGPEVILNGTPPDANVMAVQVAARRGVHVLTEIPVAPTCGLADKLIEVCGAHQVVFEVTEQVWRWAVERLKRKILKAGLIGTVQHARMMYTNKADYHGINGVRMLIGAKPNRVLGYTQEVAVPPFKHYVDPLRTRDRWDHAVIEFDNGVTCLYESPPRGRLRRTWQLEGDLGQLMDDRLFLGNESDYREYPFLTETTEVDGTIVLDHIRVETDPPVVFENPYKQYRCADGDEVARMEILLAFHAAVTSGGQVVYGPGNARTDIEILFALRESHDRGNVWVDLPLAEPTALERRIEADFHSRYGDPDDPDSLVNAAFRQGGTRYALANWE